MTDFFKSALGIFGNQNPNQGAAGGSNPAHNNSNNGNNSNQNRANKPSNIFSSLNSNDFVGQNIQIGNYRLRINAVLAEGGYAIVYLAQDVSSGAEYALKRIFSAEEASCQLIREEIAFLKKLNHPNIIKFVSAACEENPNSRTKEFLILTELCKKDPLIDHLRAGLSTPNGCAFNFEQVLNIFYQMCRSVQYLHAQEPPIIHRDLKLENFLISKNYEIKLCDFGSATTIVYHPDNTWSVNKRSLIEDEIAKQTTPMYRAPEMLDLYNNYRIDQQADIWALGCVLFLLCFNKHPFDDAAKLRIINAKYQIPQSDQEFKEFHDLIRCMLSIDPSARPNVNEVLFHLENIAESKSIAIQERLTFLKRTECMLTPENPSGTHSQANHVFSTSSTANHSNAANNANSNWMGNAGSLLKGSSLFKTIKDASSKVMDTVQSTINRSDLDMSYITSRLIVMSFPYEGLEATAYGNNIDLIKEAIETKHGRNYRVYNLASKTFRKEKLSQVIDLGSNLATNRAPCISFMCKLCANIVKFLKENSQNVCIINCMDGRSLSAIAVCTLFMYCKLIRNVDACLNLIHAKRGAINLTPIQYKFLRDTQKLFAFFRNEKLTSPFFLSPQECILQSISIDGVPMFNRMRTGCTPFVEIYHKERKIYSNLFDYDQMKKYTSKDQQILIPINCHKFYGDITVIVFHAKSLLGTEKVTTTKVCQFQFHTAFVYSQLQANRILEFKQNELDGLDSADKYPNGFRIVLNLEYKSSQSAGYAEEPWSNQQEFNSQLVNVPTQILFNNATEMSELLKTYDTSDHMYNEESEKPNLAGYSDMLQANMSDYEHSGKSSASSRSVSPMPIKSNHAATSSSSSSNEATTTKLEADLLGLNDEQTTAPTTSAYRQMSTKSNNDQPDVIEKLNDDFNLLVDFEESKTQVDAEAKPANSNVFDDLLFTSNPENDAQATSQPKRPNENLLDFDFFVQPSTNSRPSPQFPNIPAKSPTDLFISGANLPNKPANVLTPNSSSSSLKSNVSNVKHDPFGDLAELISTGTSSQPTTSSNLKQNSSSNRLNTPTSNTGSNVASNASNNSNRPPSFQDNSFPSQKPNYSIPTAKFNPTPPPPSTSTKNPDMFKDFLPKSFPANNPNRENMTIKDIMKEQNKKDVDPNKAKVMEWTDGKRANIRALLCSLHKVLWDGESRWEPVGMHQLVSADHVKKVYRKAVLAVHPDKLTDHPEIELAKLIFVELNDAWAKFQQEGQQSLY